jgi:hypothetical protein
MKYNSYRRTLIVVLDLTDPHMNHTGGVMVSVIASSAVDCGKTLIGSNQRLGISCFFAKHASLRRKSKDWLARNRDNVSEWGSMSICELLLQ